MRVFNSFSVAIMFVVKSFSLKVSNRIVHSVVWLAITMITSLMANVRAEELIRAFVYDLAWTH